MSALNATIKEIVGLFVDDSGLALWAILAIALMTVLTKLGLVPPLWGALGIILGCAAALAVSLARAGRTARY
jgi:hypothetical protein